MAEKGELREGVSSKTDELASTLMGDALDLLAAGEPFEVLLAVQEDDDQVQSFEFEDDGAEACLEAARAKVSQVPRCPPLRDLLRGRRRRRDGRLRRRASPGVWRARLARVFGLLPR